MYLSYLLNVVVLLSFSIGVSSSPVAQGTTSKCNARDIAIVKRTANEPTYFCTWWNSDTRTRTPFMELTVSQVNNACKCISKASKKDKRAATVDHPVLSKGQSVQSCRVEMSKQFTEPWHFCNFYTAYPRTTSPFRKYSAKSLLALCDCVEGNSISLTTKTSSSKKTSVAKTTIKSSSTKSSSSKKPTSSSSKKITSSKKSSLSSSSSTKSASSSSHKATPSSTKSTKPSSTTKPVSTSKSSTSSLRKTTSSSSTKKTSSSTKAKTSSSASRGSIPKSSMSTSTKSLSSTKSSSKILSSSQVTTTSSSKLSSRTSDLVKSSSASTSKSASSSSSFVSPTSSSTTKTSSISTSSESATKTPTVGMDGPFYLRVANTTAPPNDYYATADDGYGLQISRKTLFQIDSNGYLYQLAAARMDWLGIDDQGNIGVYGIFGHYSAANLRCAYDENYLLSCTTASPDGTLEPVTFSYEAFSGGFFTWKGSSAFNGRVTMNLYVELAEASTPSTTSSSSSFASPTPSSTTSTPSTSTSSDSATKTPTGRTDGQFYLRVANNEAPPDYYYVFEGEVYTMRSSRNTLFQIDSNGYLYQSKGNEYIVIYDNGDISNYGAFGQYHPGNPRCSYDENYLLSCATTSADGILLPVTFSYDANLDWKGFYAPSSIPAMDFYVELAEPSTPSTTSSSSSTTSFTTLSTAVNTASSTPYLNTTSSLTSSTTTSPPALCTAASEDSDFESCLNSCSKDPQCAGTSFDFDNGTCDYYYLDGACPTASRTPSVSVSSSSTASATESLTRSAGITSSVASSTSSNPATVSPTVAPTCTLIPRLPNGDFEDGKNQTAWSTAKNDMASWTPTITNPIDHTLSGQVTFTSDVGHGRSSLYLMNTLSNLCPGFNYSISYTSLCDVPGGSACYFTMFASESLEDEVYYGTTISGTGWVSNNDVTEFTAGRGTTTLYVYVGAAIGLEDVGWAYLDDFSITLIGDKSRVYEDED